MAEGQKRILSNQQKGHAFRKQTAGTFGPDLAKKLSTLVKMEKNLMRSMELVGRERMEAAVSNFEAIQRGVSDRYASNNFLSGVKAVMRTFPMSLINWAS